MFLAKDGRRCGFEFKYVDAPVMTQPMRTASKDLELGKLLVVYPGKKSYAMVPAAMAVSIRDISFALEW